MNTKWFAVGFMLLTGCGTTATITRRDGGSIDAKIIGGDRDNIYVDGQGYSVIPRSEVEDIDHPGNVAATIGGVVTGYGIANIAIGVPNCEKMGPAYCVGVFTPAAVGLPIMLWGIGTYAGSVMALDKAPEGRSALRFYVVPTDKVAGQPKTPGLVAGGTF
jgi:hypothetical protein